MQGIHLGLRMFRRDGRAGELTLLALAIVVAVASLTAVGLFADRVERSLSRDANQLLGGDLVLTADHPLPERYARMAQDMGLKTSASLRFTSMAGAGGTNLLVGIKAVPDSYPLRGRLRIRSGAYGPDAEVRAPPQRGTVWLDERATTALGVKPGDLVRVGSLQLRYVATLTFESDRGAGFFSFVPRLLMHRDDVAASGLIQEGSRVSYRLAMAGEAEPVARMSRWLRGELARGERMEDINNAQPEVRSTLERAQRFLRLAALLAVVFAAVALHLATNRFVTRHLDTAAILRCLGATQGRLAQILLGELFALGLIATVCGSVLGIGAQFALAELGRGITQDALPPPGWQPIAQGVAVGLVLLAGFSVPQILRLRKVPTVRVLRREWAGMQAAHWSAAAVGAGLFAALVAWVAGDIKLAAIVLGGFLAATVLYAVAAAALLRLLGHARHFGGSVRQGLAGLARRRRDMMLQCLALGLGLTTVFLVTVGQDDLVASWTRKLAPGTPNRYLLNIQPEQREAVQRALTEAGVAAVKLEPMVRGRLVAINDRPVSDEQYDGDERARRLVEREFNLSWSSVLPPGNRLIAGRWFAPQSTEAEFSVESGLARTLGLKQNDRLSFEIAGERVSARITSLRKLDWDSMNVNFFVVANPGTLDGFPASYITSFYLPADRAQLSERLLESFPNLTLIDVDALLGQLRDLLAQLARAVGFVFTFALAAGIAVLWAAIAATHDERCRELAIMRALGARRRQVTGALLTEFLVIGLIAGVLGMLGASAISAALARWVFEFPYSPSLAPNVIGLGIAIVVITCAGLIGVRRAATSPVMAALRENA